MKKSQMVSCTRLASFGLGGLGGLALALLSFMSPVIAQAEAKAHAIGSCTMSEPSGGATCVELRLFTGGATTVDSKSMDLASRELARFCKSGAYTGKALDLSAGRPCAEQKAQVSCVIQAKLPEMANGTRAEANLWLHSPTAKATSLASFCRSLSGKYFSATPRNAADQQIDAE